MQSEIEDPIPAPLQDFYALFKQDLSNVAFPDISIEVLEKLMSDVHEKTKELQDAYSLVTAAQEALEASQNELLQKAVRGLAYAKIYAEGQEELSEKLAKINLTKTNRTTKKAASEPSEGKRSRSKKTEEQKEELSPEEVSE